MKVAAVAAGSIAERAGIMPGDRILTIGGQRVRDSLDFAFLATEASLCFGVRRTGGRTERITLERTAGEELGILPVPDPVRRCANDCVFCFIDQNPKGLRPSLHVKDEDYRLSLLFGNYVTLTPLRGWEIERIIAQHLSPLYVSVHATDPIARRRLLRCRGAAEILPLLGRLARGGIELHTQIVLVPGYNDGGVLEQTLVDLEQLWPAVRSVAIVPVGLTRHRAGRPRLRRVSPAEARRLAAAIEQRQAALLRKHGTRLIYLADELYLQGGIELPPVTAYEGFPQAENGVGLVRQFDRSLRQRRRLLAGGRAVRDAPRSAWRSGGVGERLLRRRVVAVSGRLFAPLLRDRLAAALQRTSEDRAWRFAVCAVANDLFGRRVTVAGLLGGADMVRALRRFPPFERALLPPEAFNENGVTLDEFTPGCIANLIGAEVQLGLGARARLVRPTPRKGKQESL